MKMEETNVHLIEECRRGNRTAQLALYKQFAQRLYVACLRIVGNVPEAEEAMQDSFLKIFTRLDQYRDGQCFEAFHQTEHDGTGEQAQIIDGKHF